MGKAGISEATITLFRSKVPAGFPSPANDYMEERIDLNSFLIRHPLSTFIVESEGNSMIDAFIPPKAKLLVDKSIEPKNGDIVLAIINGEFTVKYLKKNEFKCWLVPANKKYHEIEVTPEMNFKVWGVVTSIIVNPNELRCMP